MAWSLVGKSNAGFVAALCLMAAMGVLSYQSARSMAYAMRQEDQARARLQVLDGMLVAMSEAESDQRNYLLSGDPSYVRPYMTAAARLAQNTLGLRDLLRDEPRALQELALIEGTIQAHLNDLARLAVERALGSAPAARSYQQQQMADEIRGQLGAMRMSEAGRVHSQALALEATLRRTPLVIGVVSVVGFLLLAVASYFVNVDRSKRQAAERDLIGAKEEATQAAQAKASFLATMSHEIRTPLNGITGMSELLMETSLTQDQRHFAEVVQRSATALLGIVNDILDFSKIEAGKLILESLPFSPVNLVESELDIVGELADKKQLNLSSYVDSLVPPRLLGDAGRLGQILLNLLSNAVKFTPPNGSALLQVRMTGTAGQPRVRFSVADSGIGISPEAQSRLFSPFSQADASVTRVYGGTGLGLAISRRLVDMMGGSIGVQSEAGQGSTFWLEVPLPADPTGVPETPAPVGARGLRVMAVDDDPVARGILGRYLRAWGVGCTEAADRVEAVNLLQAAQRLGSPFNVVFIDRQGDGLSTAQSILADESLRPQPRLVMLGPRERGAQRTNVVSLGFVAFLPKPLKQSLLRDTLVALCGVAPAAPVIHEHSGGKPQVVQGKIILVAEDNAVNQLLITRQLESLGYGVNVVGNGREAVEALANKSYDLVLMDCQMPEMDGYEAARRIREREASQQRSRLPILAITANAMEGDATKCLDAGMDGHLAKPLRKEHLAQALRKWLEPEI